MTAIVRCEHFVDNKRVPCPPQCPRQDWPADVPVTDQGGVVDA